MRILIEIAVFLSVLTAWVFVVKQITKKDKK